MALPARIGLALAAVAVAAGLALGLRGHQLLQSAKDRAGDTGEHPLSAERRRDVLSDLEDSGGLRPGTDALVLRARVEARAGRYEESIALARRAVAKEPESYLAWAVLTFVLVAGEQQPAALRALERAKELNPLVLTRG